MKYPVASFFLPLFLIPVALGQSKSQSGRRSAPQSGTHIKRSVSQSKCGPPARRNASSAALMWSVISCVLFGLTIRMRSLMAVLFRS